MSGDRRESTDGEESPKRHVQAKDEEGEEEAVHDGGSREKTIKSEKPTSPLVGVAMLNGALPTPSKSPHKAESPAFKVENVDEDEVKDDDEEKEEKEEEEEEEKASASDAVTDEEVEPARFKPQKVPPRTPKLFDHLPDHTEQATETFQLMQDCNYAAKYLGASDQEAMGCECTAQWDGDSNHACGDESDCINRMTKIECIDNECNCGANCQNQRFQLRQYAKVSVISTEKKGYGLRADRDMNANDFVFEYIGDVINETVFRRRMVQYDEEGVKHFYFMSLQKGIFVDATKRGNLGRFCNHSCNPNCYVDKWVVGDKLRMGIFTQRKIKAGEELVFNYNVDRYGADPQPCYCDEPNCTGFLGGKTQTERATKLPIQTLEALGIDDGDGWDSSFIKKPRKKKASEDDEEYVNSIPMKPLDDYSVTKVMATLIQVKEKWIVVKILGRIQQCDNERVRNQVVRFHGYQILNSTLSTWKEDVNIVLQIMDILTMFPRLTRNKIADSKIESTIEGLQSCEDERVQKESSFLLKEWATLEVGYRIPRRKRELITNIANERSERRDSKTEEKKSRSPSRSRSPEPSRSFHPPPGPRGPRNSYHPPRPRRPFNPLPSGWFAAQANGRTYYYSVNGQTTWTRPTAPAEQPPPPPKGVSSEQRLQEIIDSITKDQKEEKPTSTMPQAQVSAQAPEPTPRKEKKDKWKSYPEEKKKKLYENTLFPHIKHVMDKFKTKLPREDVKRFGKDVAKKLVSSDFKNNRVDNPTKISERQEKQVKKYVKEFFDKAVAKKREHDKKKAAKQAPKSARPEPSKADKDRSPTGPSEEEVVMSDHDVDDDDDEDGYEPRSSLAGSPAVNGENLKRKRDSNEFDEPGSADRDQTPSKRIKSATPPPPPPPPPPPATEELPEYDESMEADIPLDNDDASPVELPVGKIPRGPALQDPTTPSPLGETPHAWNGTSHSPSESYLREGDPDKPNGMEIMNSETRNQLGIHSGA